MAVGIQIQDKDSRNKAVVTKRGQVVVAPLDFSTPVSILMDVDNQPYTFFKPITGKKFVITDIILSTTFNVGVNGATIEIYEADEEDSATSINDLVTLNIIKSTAFPLNNLNWTIAEGSFLVAKTNDDDVYMTIAGYYIKA